MPIVTIGSTAFFLLSTILTTTTVTVLSMSLPQKPFALNVRLDVKPERRDEFLQIIQNDQSNTIANEPDALQFVVGNDVDSPNTFYLHEQYKSEDAFQYHTETPHYAEWKKFCDTEPFSVAPMVDFFVGTQEAEKIPIRTAFCLNVELNIQPTVRDKFLEVIHNNQKGSCNTEPLCLQYHYGESTTTPNTFFFHEEYTGENDGMEGFQAHQSTPHFAMWETFASTGEPFTKPPVVQMYKSNSVDSEDS